ncbi:MAG: ATP-binding cassette domain-containing protein [Pseudomonadota bacterium]
MLLSVENLDVRYGSAQVLHDVSLSLEPGELVCIVGRNGAGKTTLLKTIAGFLAPSAGRIAFHGQDLAGVAPDKVALRGLRYVFQDKRVFGELTVRDNLELAAFPSREPLEQAVAKLVAIHPKMGKLLDSKAKGLSGGERQILLIGRAMVGSPELLLIDEPTEGLAAIIIGQIINILQSMKSKLSMIVVEQNLSTVARLADRIYVLKEGAIHRNIVDPEVIRQPRLYENDL